MLFWKLAGAVREMDLTCDWRYTGVMGGDAQLDQSTLGNFSSCSALIPSSPSSPENIGLSGVWSTSQLPGLPMTLLDDDDNGGVEGKYSVSRNSVSSTMDGLWASGWGDAIGVIATAKLAL
jgi:hypothetical protein